MRNPTLKSLVLFAAVVSTVVMGVVLYKSWEMVSTPRPTLEGIAGVEDPRSLAAAGKPGEAGHGKPAGQGGHGGHSAETGERAPAAYSGPVAPVVALDEVYVSLGGATAERTRSLVVNLELELFEEKGRDTVDKFRPAVRDLVLQAAMEQPYDGLRTLPGKLSFKEVLVSRINKLVNQAVIRNVHFATFYLQ
jgi:flagellar basal body-associated protein FliL